MKGIAQRYKIIPSDVGPSTSRPNPTPQVSCYERLPPVVDARVTLAHTAMRRKLLPGASADRHAGKFRFLDPPIGIRFKTVVGPDMPRRLLMSLAKSAWGDSMLGVRVVNPTALVPGAFG